jgi:hypothetical protein
MTTEALSLLDDTLPGLPFVEPEPSSIPFPSEREFPIPSADRRRIRLAPAARRRNAAQPLLLPLSPPLFPWLARRLVPGEATLWIGPPATIEGMLETLYVGNALARGRISLIEGRNQFHPYRIGERGRALGIDPTAVLDRIRLARAFTAYQLVALVDGWATELRRHSPTLLVAHDLPTLFFTEEVPSEERAPLLRYVAQRLREILEVHALPLVLTLDGGFARFPGLPDGGPRFADLLTITPRPGATVTLHALRDDARLTLVPRSPGQHGIDEFDSTAPSEVIAWEGRPPRIGKRSKSG